MEHMDAAVPIFQRRVGPLGLDVPPAGEAEFDHLVEEYRAQLGAGQGPVHINCMIGMAECRAAILAARELGYGPLWVSWSCNEEGESATRVHMLAALFVAEGMGAAAFGLNCPKELALEQLEELSRYASVPLFYVVDGDVVTYPYVVQEKDPDVIPCATGTSPCFVTRTVDVGEELECTPKLLEDIINGTTQVSEGIAQGMGIDIKALLSGMLGGKVAAEHQEAPAPAAPPVEAAPAEPSTDVQTPEKTE